MIHRKFVFNTFYCEDYYRLGLDNEESGNSL
jgi:hypothetical protein